MNNTSLKPRIEDTPMSNPRHATFTAACEIPFVGVKKTNVSGPKKKKKIHRKKEESPPAHLHFFCTRFICLLTKHHGRSPWQRTTVNRKLMSARACTQITARVCDRAPQPCLNEALCLIIMKTQSCARSCERRPEQEFYYITSVNFLSYFFLFFSCFHCR